MSGQMNLSVELAPRHKSGLTLATPLILACGSAGYSILPPLVEREAVGALATLPLCLAGRAAEQPAGFAEIPGGVVLAHPRPAAVRSILRRWGRQWARHKIPIIAHLEPDSPDEMAACATTLEESREVLAIEFRADLLPLGSVAEAVGHLRTSSDKPLLAQLPLFQARAYYDAIGEQADAYVVAASPQGIAWSSDAGRWVEGEVHGVGVFPLMMKALRDLSDAPYPLIALGGIHSPSQAVQAILASATAVMFDTAVYRDPNLPDAALTAIMDEMKNRGLEDVRELVGRELR